MTDEARGRLEEVYRLRRKYASLPRAGWAAKGSRAKSNQTVTVPREEVIKLADECYGALLARAALITENLNLKHYMEQLAKGEHDAAECPICHAIYQSGWLGGKCPYCEAADAAWADKNRGG